MNSGATADSTVSHDHRPLNAAIMVSTAVHAHETRADGRPYIVHPLGVVRRMREAGHDDPQLLTLAVLHDVLESAPDCEAVLRQIFGGPVVDGVRYLTVDTSLDADARKAAQLVAIATAPAHVRLVKLADRLDNIEDIGIDTPAAWSVEKKRRYLDQTLSMLPAFLDLASPLLGRLLAALGANPLLTDAQRQRLARTVSR